MDENLTPMQVEEILQRVKWERIAALAAAAGAGKDAPAGHRVYLRAMTMLEIELGIRNEHNYEVKEGFLDNVETLMRKPTKDEDLLVE